MVRFVKTIFLSLLVAACSIAGPKQGNPLLIPEKPKAPVTAKSAEKSKQPVKEMLSAAPVDTVDDSSRVLVRIQRLSVIGRPVNDTLLVTLQTSKRNIAGYDLKIGLTSPYVRIVGMLRGEILDSCRWGYFNAKEMPVRDEPGRPRSVWQAVALAQTIGDSKKPQCYGFEREASILKLVLSNSHVLQMPETTAALFFWWEDCTDNVLSGSSGEQLYMSLNVLDQYPVDIAETDSVFPNHKGAISLCVKPRAVNRPKRLVEFYNGGIEWRAGVITVDSIEVKNK